jgi:hypothetical protein
MSRPFAIYPPETGYQRNVLFAVEVLDGVTLQRLRLSDGVTVTASGLTHGPQTNSSGLFVWLKEDPSALQSISVDPGVLPFETMQLPAAQVQMRFQSIELAPTCNYPFATGMTGLCGSLIEQRVTAPDIAQPVTDASVRLLWLADDGVTWNNAPTVSHPNAHGDFAAMLRFTPTDVPNQDANGYLTVRLRAARASTGTELGTGNFSLQQGRVADALTYLKAGGAPPALVFAWNELQP